MQRAVHRSSWGLLAATRGGAAARRWRWSLVGRLTMLLWNASACRYEGLVKEDKCHVRGVFKYSNGDRCAHSGQGLASSALP